MSRVLLVLAVLSAGCAGTVDVVPADARGFPVAADAAAWERLSAGPPRLPAWSRALVGPLPRTTALQVNLDHLHRRRNPLGAALSAKLRWVVADANRCDYARESAAADLAAAKVPAAEIEALADPPADAKDGAALRFARRLTLEAAAITDEEVAGLLAAMGPEDAVAVVHTVAHANFQDRLLLALGLVAEPGGATPPCEARPPSAEGPVAPPRFIPKSVPPEAVSVEAGEKAWSARSIAELRDLLESQKARGPRIPLPDATRRARLPRAMRERPGRTLWGDVALSYQPEMTAAWFRTMESFDKESGLDEVFANSVFWVVTRTSDCFY